MPLIRFLERFGLDTQAIGRDREMSAGLGQALLGRADNTETSDARFAHELAAASQFRRAGAHSILLSDRRAAAVHFIQAGECYARLGNPYGLLMFACADYSPSDLRPQSDEFGFFERKPPDRLQTAYLLLAAAAGGWGEDRVAPFHHELHASRTSPIGVLGLPLGTYLDLARALDSGETERIEWTLIPFWVACSAAMARARDNRYHWPRMALPFHPAEPDILSVTFLVEAAVRRRGGTLVYALLEKGFLPPDSADLIYNAVSERFGDPH